MALITNVSKNGMSGDVYLTIISSTDSKYSGVTSFILRGFESREILYSHIAGEIEGNVISFEEEYEMPLVDMDKPSRSQIYEWLKHNHFKEAIDA